MWHIVLGYHLIKAATSQRKCLFPITQGNRTPTCFLYHVVFCHRSHFLLDEPKSPGPVELLQTVHDKLVVSWAPSPDQDLDDRLYYVVSQHDSHMRVWKTAADRLFTNTYTVNNILPGIQYHFRIYAKNDMGLSDPSQSPPWGINSSRGEILLYDDAIIFI